jgi:hypothetical protein
MRAKLNCNNSLHGILDDSIAERPPSRQAREAREAREADNAYQVLAVTLCRPERRAISAGCRATLMRAFPRKVCLFSV